MKALWWILGLAAAGTGVYFISEKLMNPTPEPNPEPTALPKANLCVNDLTEPFKTQVLEAVRTNDSSRLAAYAKQATDLGWTCAASDMQKIIDEIAKSKPVGQVIQPSNQLQQEISNSAAQLSPESKARSNAIAARTAANKALAVTAQYWVDYLNATTAADTAAAKKKYDTAKLASDSADASASAAEKQYSAINPANAANTKAQYARSAATKADAVTKAAHEYSLTHLADVDAMKKYQAAKFVSDALDAAADNAEKAAGTGASSGLGAFSALTDAILPLG